MLASAFADVRSIVIALTASCSVMLSPGCAVEGTTVDDDVHDDVADAADAELSADLDTTGWEVEDAIRRVCTTSVVAPLAEQLIDELECLYPGSMARIDNLPGVTLRLGTRPYLQRAAAEALALAGRAVGITVSSGLRTLPQQFLLHQWYVRGRCRSSVRLAASPGNSPHESGLAVDVSYHSRVRVALETHGYDWHGSSDRVHFDYLGGLDIREPSVLAFQRLWNLNNPSDPITVDGDYGNETASRMKRSPVNGFPLNSTCSATPRVVIETGWSTLPDGRTRLWAEAPAEAETVEFALGGNKLVSVARNAEGAFAIDLDVFEDRTALLEAEAFDVNGESVGLGRDTFEPITESIRATATLSPL